MTFPLAGDACRTHIPNTIVRLTSSDVLVRCACHFVRAGVQGLVRPASDAHRLGTERERARRYAAAAGGSETTHKTSRGCFNCCFLFGVFFLAHVQV